MKCANCKNVGLKKLMFQCDRCGKHVCPMCCLEYCDAPICQKCAGYDDSRMLAELRVGAATDDD